MSAEWKLPWSASCLCGQVKMRIMQPPMVAMACHCRGCQKLTSGAYSLTLMIPTDGFEVVAGAPERGGLHREQIEHWFCPHCKNWLFSRPQGQAFVNFRPTMLEDASWVVPFVDCCVDEKMPAAISGAAHAYPGFPPPSDYQMLMEGYAREGSKPR